jgi:hypothetical protein
MIMEEKNINDIKIFEAPDSYKFTFEFPKYSLLALAVLAMLFGICIYQGAVKVHESIKDILSAVSVISIILFAIFLLILPAIWRIKRARNIIKLIIDPRKKEFQAILDKKNTVISFKSNDIKEICISSEMVRFFLKDKTWVTWTIDPKNQKTLEGTIASLSIPIIRKIYIW